MEAEKITDAELETLRQSSEKMLSRYSPAVDEAWWRNLHSAVVELQERRAAGIKGE
ncbi:hypothetical protein [Leclercia adecarboxylata]|uniref:hypothetical protein n=1 Tax=Leclercia adecarboxylata TaxID=83655 RepID=UPI001642824B|nr:hypothetical protein [Leclercia adecarboxylata]